MMCRIENLCENIVACRECAILCLVGVQNREVNQENHVYHAIYG